MATLNWLNGQINIDPRAIFVGISSNTFVSFEERTSVFLNRADGLKIELIGTGLKTIGPATTAVTGSVSSIKIFGLSGDIVGSISLTNAIDATHFVNGYGFLRTEYLNPFEEIFSNNDVMIGNNSSNSFYGGMGWDTIDGNGGIDQAIFSGNRLDYLLRKSGDSYTLANNSSIDVVTNVELFHFAGSGTTISAETWTPSNFNGDLQSDLLWTNSNGAAVAFLMDGASIESASAIGPANGSSWHLKASADLDGDGQSDMIWQNADGRVVAYLMNGTAIRDAAVIADPSAAFEVVGTGDLNGDGRADIILQDAHGQAVGWLMNGTSITSAAAIGGRNGAEWRVAAVGDISGDGRSDIVWTDNTGQAVGFLMNGTSVFDGQYLGGPNGSGFSVRGIGDLNGDGRGDIVWQFNNGQGGAWLMNGNSIVGAGGIGGVNGARFQIRDIADLNGDGLMDIVWQDRDNGQAAVFMMDGLNVTAGSYIGGANGSDWLIVG